MDQPLSFCMVWLWLGELFKCALIPKVNGWAFMYMEGDICVRLMIGWRTQNGFWIQKPLLDFEAALPVAQRSKCHANQIAMLWLPPVWAVMKWLQFPHNHYFIMCFPCSTWTISTWDQFSLSDFIPVNGLYFCLDWLAILHFPFAEVICGGETLKLMCSISVTHINCLIIVLFSCNLSLPFKYKTWGKFNQHDGYSSVSRYISTKLKAWHPSCPDGKCCTLHPSRRADSALCVLAWLP